MFFLCPKINLFFSECFLSPEINCFFLGNRQQSNARAGQKKPHVFFGNARPKSNARAHLKQRKKHSGLINQSKLNTKSTYMVVSDMTKRFLITPPDKNS